MLRRYAALKARHADLERQIGEELKRSAPDGLEIQRLKRARLHIKSQIVVLRDMWRRRRDRKRGRWIARATGA